MHKMTMLGAGFIGRFYTSTLHGHWADTQVHPIEAEDHAIGLVRYQNGLTFHALNRES